MNTIPQGLEAPHYPGYTKLRLGVPKGVFRVFGYKGNLRTVDCGGSHRDGWGTCEDLPVAVAVLHQNRKCWPSGFVTYIRTYTRTYVHTSVQCVVCSIRQSLYCIRIFMYVRMYTLILNYNIILTIILYYIYTILYTIHTIIKLSPDIIRINKSFSDMQHITAIKSTQIWHEGRVQV